LSIQNIDCPHNVSLKLKDVIKSVAFASLIVIVTVD